MLSVLFLTAAGRPPTIWRGRPPPSRRWSSRAGPSSRRPYPRTPCGPPGARSAAGNSSARKRPGQRRKGPRGLPLLTGGPVGKGRPVNPPGPGGGLCGPLAATVPGTTATKALTSEVARSARPSPLTSQQPASDEPRQSSRRSPPATNSAVSPPATARIAGQISPRNSTSAARRPASTHRRAPFRAHEPFRAPDRTRTPAAPGPAARGPAYEQIGGSGPRDRLRAPGRGKN